MSKIKNYLSEVEEVLEHKIQTAMEDQDIGVVFAAKELKWYITSLHVMPDNAFKMIYDSIDEVDFSAFDLFDVWITFALHGLVFDKNSCPI